MTHIRRVGIVGDDMLDVQLDNGNILLLELAQILGHPSYAALREDDRILYPKTDGTSVYWRDGPVLSIQEMMQMLSIAL